MKERTKQGNTGENSTLTEETEKTERLRGYIKRLVYDEMKPETQTDIEAANAIIEAASTIFIQVFTDD